MREILSTQKSFKSSLYNFSYLTNRTHASVSLVDNLEANLMKIIKYVN